MMELRECPFCGARAVITESLGTYSVYCVSCNCEVNGGREKSKTIEKWNTRYSINTPKHETVEEWEKRNGESYPDDAPVWEWDAEAFSDCGDWIPRIWEDFSPGKSVLVANHHGKPEEV